MSEVLELPHLAEDDGVAEVNVGAGGVETEFYAEPLALLVGVCELLGKFCDVEYLDGTAFEEFDLFFDSLSHIFTIVVIGKPGL